MISLHRSTDPFEFDDSDWFGCEKPSVLEAFRVLSKEGYCITISVYDDDMRKKRLEKECEESTKAPGSAENLIKEESGVSPALAESSTRFNDALPDDQGKKIKRLGKEITRLNKIIHKKNFRIGELRKESSRHLRGKMNLEQELKDKDAVLSDVAEELRLSGIREKNLADVCQKYVKECEELSEKVAEKAKLVEIVRKGSREYCEYGIAAEKMIQKMARDIVNDRPVSPKDYEQYHLWAKGYRFNPQLPERTDEEEKKLNTAKSTLGDLKEKAYDSLNAKAHDLGPAGRRDGNGISGQMVVVDISEEGSGHSGVIVLCGKDLIDAIKKMK